MADDFVTRVNPLPGETAEVSPEISPMPEGPPAAEAPTVELSQTPRELSAQAELPVQPIDNTNKNFKGHQKNETVHTFTRKHWVVLLPHLIGFVFVLAALAGFFFFATKANMASIVPMAIYRWAAVLAILGLTYYLHRLFLRFFNYYLQTIIITNFRVIHLDQTLYFNRSRDSIDLSEIQNIVIEQKGIFKSLLNYGEIIITLSSAYASKTLYCIPNPEYFFRKINKTKREYITTRRVIKGVEEKR